MSYFQARLAEVQIPPKKPQKYLFHVPRTKTAPCGVLSFIFAANYARVARARENPTVCAKYHYSISH